MRVLLIFIIFINFNFLVFLKSTISNYQEISESKNFWLQTPMIMGLVTESRVYDIPTNCEIKTEISSNLKNDSTNFEEKELERKQLLVNDKKEMIDISLMIIARKEVCRMGARFFSRGIDKNGNVSNFAETEQIFRLRTPSKKGRLMLNIRRFEQRKDIYFNANPRIHSYFLDSNPIFKIYPQM